MVSSEVCIRLWGGASTNAEITLYQIMPLTFLLGQFRTLAMF